MKHDKSRSIAFQIIIPACLIAALTLVALGVVLIGKGRVHTDELFGSKGRSLCNLLEKISAPYIVNYDYPSLEVFVAEAVKDADVKFAVIYDTKKNALTRTSQEPENVSALTVYEREIKDPDGKAAVGVLRLGYSQEGLQRAVRDNVITTAVAILCGLALIGAGLGWVTRRVTRRVKTIISHLTEAQREINAASGQIAVASQTLAKGASAQAAAVQETSSSLEEMSSMTTRNAENALQADNLMREANGVIEHANASMGALINSMEGISRASEETSKIIRTIDEIAFQTNLLALNAAVEAARAGEAGAGFAVVADEVRNLARRAAEAAKNTASLIEGTVGQVREGSELVGSTGTAFSEVARSSEKVAGLISEIAAASGEQAQGIAQVNKAVAEIEKVVQQNAASAEESASASEQMDAQARNMKGLVGDLGRLVAGGSTALQGRAAPAPAANKVQAAQPKGRPAAPAGAVDKAAGPSEKMPASVLIPLDDEGFKDF